MKEPECIYSITSEIVMRKVEEYFITIKSHCEGGVLPKILHG